MSDVSELFGEGGGVPEPRTGLVLGLLGTGAALGAAGLFCSVVPAVATALVAWFLAEKEHDRVQTGYLPREAGPVVDRLRSAAVASVVVLALLTIIQFFGYSAGLYDELLFMILESVAVEPPPA